VTFESEITAPVTVEVLDATRETRGRFGDAPERCYPSEGDSVELAVRLGGVDITAALPADVLEGLASEALDRLAEP
jgi:hypothetical protein